MTSLPTLPTRYPYNGIMYQTPGGSVEWIPLSDGTLHMVRTDAGPVDTFTLDVRNKRFMPSTDDGAAQQVEPSAGIRCMPNSSRRARQNGHQDRVRQRGPCAVGSLYTNTSATTTTAVLYVCGPASAWRAVPVQSEGRRANAEDRYHERAYCCRLTPG